MKAAQKWALYHENLRLERTLRAKNFIFPKCSIHHNNVALVLKVIQAYGVTFSVHEVINEYYHKFLFNHPAHTIKQRANLIRSNDFVWEHFRDWFDTIIQNLNLCTPS